MAHSTPSSPSVLSSSVLSSNFGVLSASDIESHSERASQSDSDFEVVLVQPTSTLAISDSDSGSLVSAPTDSLESSDDEHIMVPNISQSTPNTPRPPSLTPARLLATPRPASVALARPIVESGHDSDASDREDDSSNASTYESDSNSDSDSGSVLHAHARTVTITNDRLEAPLTMGSTTSLGTVHANGSTATIRPASLTRPVRRSTPAGMHTPAITTNTIMGIMSSAPLSPPTPSDGGEIPYAPFTAAPTAVSVPRPAPAPRPASVPSSSAAKASPPPAKKSQVIPSVIEPPTKKTSKKEWSAMNVARVKLGLEPLQHILRKQNNAAIKARKKGGNEAAAKAKVAEAQAKNKAKAKAKAEAKAKAKSEAKAKAKVEAEAKGKAKAGAKAKASASKTKPVVAPRPTIGASPVTSEDETPRMRASMFSPVNDISVRSESPDEEAYDAAIKQLDEHMSSPPEHPTATYRYLLNRALLLEFRVCTPETLPTSHGAAIAMVKSNVHINVLDYVAKRKEGFNGLRTVMLANAKALRKDVQKRRMPVKVVKSLGLHSLLVLT